MSQENVDVTRRAIQAFEERDLDALLALLDDDVEAYLGDSTIAVLHIRGHGSESDTPVDATALQVTDFRGGSASCGASSPANAKPSKRGALGVGGGPHVAIGERHYGSR